ncbi:MAG: flavodoxin domain-containing protein, partial [Vampirovibrionia bacterium]
YYANIVCPYSPFVTKLLDKVASLNLDIKYIATDHGPVWRERINDIINFYRNWAEQKPTNTVIIVYDTMWGSTHKMATAIAEGVRQEGVTARLTSLKASHRSDVMIKVFNAGALVVGSPVLNSNLFPTVVDVLTYIKGLKPNNLLCSSFGSYGWNKAPLNELKDILTNEIKAEYVGELVTANYVPDDEVLKQCVEQGRLIAKKLKEITNEQTVEMQRMWVHS